MKTIVLAEKLSNKYAQMIADEDLPATVIPPPLVSEPINEEPIKSNDVRIVQHLIGLFDKTNLLSRGEGSHLQKLLDEKQNSKEILMILIDKLDEWSQKIYSARKEISKWQDSF